MADFKNHKRFSLRCLSEDVIPVSIKLKSNIRTPKGQYIIRRAEKALLNEKIRSINNTINMLNHQRDTCKTDLEKRIREESMEECQYSLTSGKKQGISRPWRVKNRKLTDCAIKTVSARVATQTCMVTIQYQ